MTAPESAMPSTYLSAAHVELLTDCHTPAMQRLALDAMGIPFTLGPAAEPLVLRSVLAAVARDPDADVTGAFSLQ